MPNYSLVVNSQFRPFSYAELAAPVMEMSNYHEKLAQEYDNLSKQADVLEMLGNNDRDKSSNSYNKYKSYSDSLRKEADDLFANGLNLESRRRLTDLRRMYNTDIVPIQTAYAKREQEAAQQMQAYLQNPSLMFTRDANNSSIDEYVSNPNGGYGVINGTTITAQMSAMASNLAKQIKSGRRENIDEFTYNYINEHGLDENIIRNWQNSPTLTTMFNQVMKANGVSEDALKNSLNAQNIIDKSRGYAEMGMWNAMGADTAEKVENFGARQALELDTYMKKKAIDAQYAQQQGGDTDLMGETVGINFSDPESAGLSMKRKLAEATAEYIYNVGAENAQSKKIRDYWEKHGGREAAVKHWETKGFNGNEEWLGKGSSSISTRLGNYLKDTVVDSDDIVNIWKSGYETSKLPSKGAIGNPYNRNYYEAYKDQMDAKTRKNYEEGLAINEGRAKNGLKNWKDFDKLSSNGYAVNAVVLRDDPTDLKEWLDRTLSRNMRDGNVKLYDIKKIDADNNYTYSEQGSTSRKDLPQDSNGKIDYSRIHRAKLSNGDYLLYWDDGKETKQKVLKLQDISKEAMSDRDKKDLMLQNVESLYKQNKITKAQREELHRRILNQDIANSMDAIRRYNVKETEI